MKNQETYTFRELLGKKELELFMKLRYDRYISGSMKNFLHLNEHGIDMDVYDLHSKHYGLFYNEKPSGYIRVVLHKNVLYNKEVYSIGEQYRLLEEKSHKNGSLLKFDYPDFPFANNPEVPQSVGEYYKGLGKGREGLVEASRLMLFGSSNGFNKARFMTECAVVLYVLVSEGSGHAVINCDTSHAKFYNAYGFEVVNNEKTYHIKGRNTKPSYLLSLPLTLSNVPQAHHDKFKEMAEEFETTGKIERCM